MKKVVALFMSIMMLVSLPMEALASNMFSQKPLEKSLLSEEEIQMESEVSEKGEGKIERTVSENVEEEENVIIGEQEEEKQSEIPSQQVSEEENENVEIKYSGTYTDYGANLTWQIDSNYKLTIQGTGVTELVESYKEYIWPWKSQVFKHVEVNVTGSVSLRQFFNYCNSLITADLSGMDVSQVTDMSEMFFGCGNLESVNTSGWDTSNVENMSQFFRGCESLKNMDVSKWNTSSVTNMSHLFSYCESLKSIDVSKWNTSSVTNMSYLFQGCESLESIDVSKWNTSSVTNMSHLFSYCKSLESMDVSAWNTGSVTNMERMFAYCPVSSLDLSKWNTSSMTDMQFIFTYSGVKTLNLSDWDVSNVTNMLRMCENCYQLESIDVSGWNTSKVSNMMGMFNNCSSLESFDASDWDTSSLTITDGMFNKCTSLKTVDVGTWDTSNLDNMSGMFSECKSLKNLNLSHWNTEKVTQAYKMFSGCSLLEEVGESGWKLPNLEEAGYMFYGCAELKSLDTSGWTISSLVNSNVMFSGCSALQSLDVSGWDTSNLVNSAGMFSGCSTLKSLDVSDWNTYKMVDANSMFSACSALEVLDVSKWNTVSLKKTNYMFNGCASLKSLDLGSWDIAKVTTMLHLLDGCNQLTTIIAPCNVKYSVTLPAENNDKWYLSDGRVVTTIPALQNYSPAIGKNYIPDSSLDRRPPEDISTGGTRINGIGRACVKIALLSNSGILQREKEVKYVMSDSSSAVLAEDTQIAKSDKTGYVILQTPLLQHSNTTDEDEKVSYVARLWMKNADGIWEELSYKVTVDATITPLAFKQSWELATYGTIAGKVSEGAAAGVGVAKAGVSLAEAKIGLNKGGVLSVEQAFEGEKRTLTLLQSYSAGILASASAGLTGEIGVLEQDFEVDVFSAEAGIASESNGGIGMEIKDYDPSNMNQLTQIGRFMLAAQAQSQGNVLLLLLAEKCGANLYNLKQAGNTISLSAGAKLGEVDFNDWATGSLAATEASSILTYDQIENKEEGVKTYTFGHETAAEGGIGNIELGWVVDNDDADIKLGDLESNFFTRSMASRIEFSAQKDENDAIQNMTFKKELQTEEEETIAFTEISYEGEEAVKIQNAFQPLSDFVTGQKHYMLGDARREMYLQLDAAQIVGNYTTGIEKRKTAELELEAELTLGLGVEAGIGLEGVHSYEYETARGSYYKGERKLSSRNEIDTLVSEKDAQNNIFMLIGEPLGEIAKTAKNFLKELTGNMKDGIEAGLAELKQKGTEILEGAGWTLHLVFMGEEPEVVSYEISAYTLPEEVTSQAVTDTELEAEETRVYTIGSPYYVYVTNERGDRVTDYTEHSLELTLRYTDEMLKKAGMEEEAVNKLAIYRHSGELSGYVCIGGELDKANKSVTVTITEPGQYILAADEKEPKITRIQVETQENIPTITIGFDEDCGFGEFSLKIDDNQYVNSENWKQYYNASRCELVYELKEGLEDGIHRVEVFVSDSAGNKMKEPLSASFLIDTKTPVMKEMNLSAKGENVTITALCEDTDIESVTATIFQKQKDGTIKESTCELINTEGIYTAQIVVEKETVTVQVSVVAVDMNGNQSEPISDSVEIARRKDGLWYAFIDGSGDDKNIYTYTGLAIKPKLEIYDGETLLTEKKDYTLSYSKNVNVGIGVITVTGKGNYGQKTTIHFTIEPKDISKGAEGIIVSELVAAANGKVQKPIPVMKYNNKKLSNSKNKDFTVSYPNTEEGAYKLPESYIVHVEGNGNYTGSRDIEFLIGGKTAGKLSVGKIQNFEYTGSIIEPELTVKDGRKLLEEGKHYSKEYVNNKEIGTAKVIITGIAPDYVGTKTVTFKITGISMSKAGFSSLPKNVIYSGEAKEPKITVTYKDETLQPGKDYEISYDKNVNATTAVVQVIGKGRYYGTVKKTFKIMPFDATKNEGNLISIQDGIRAVYAKGGAKPLVEVKFNGQTLNAGTDYTLAYSNHKTVTSENTKSLPTITVKFKGNYKGSRKTTFTILPQSLEYLNAVGVDKVVSTKNNGWKSTVIITDLDGKVLKAGTDYEKNLAYYLDEACTKKAEASVYDAGTKIWVRVTGKGNYVGSETVCDYRITPISISKAKVKITDQTYKGSQITIDESQIQYVKVGKNTLTISEHYEIIEGSYKNNVEKGTATVQMKGIGNYGGIITAKFKIKQKAFQWKTIWNLLGTLGKDA